MSAAPRVWVVEEALDRGWLIYSIYLQKAKGGQMLEELKQIYHWKKFRLVPYVRRQP